MPSPRVISPAAEDLEAQLDRTERAAPAAGTNRLAMGRADVLAATVFIGLISAVAILLGIALRSTALAEAHRTLDEMAGVVAEQVSRMIQIVDITLENTTHRIELAAARAGVPAHALLGSDEADAILQDHVRKNWRQPALALADPDGRILGRGAPRPGAAVEAALADAAVTLAGNNAPDLYITPPTESRVDGLQVVFVAKRLEFGTGTLKGIALASVPLRELTATLKRRTTLRDAVITLARGDGIVLARSPADPPPDTDDRPALTAQRPAANDALLVTVVASQDGALAHWRQQAVAIVAVTLVLITAALLLLAAMLRHLRAERAAQHALLRQNNELEAAHRSLKLKTTELETSAGALRSGEALLAERSAILNTTLENIGQGIMMVDANGRVRVYNKRLVELLDLPEALLARAPLLTEVLQYQFDAGEFAHTDQSVVALVKAGGIARDKAVYQRMRPNGTVVEVSSLPLPGGGIVRTYTDITDLRRAQDQIEQIALFDELTGLPNRVSFRSTLQARLAARADADRLGLLYLNLDRFRLLNDARGYEAGDQTLQEVARRLQNAAALGDVVSRTGGDEFAILHALPPDRDDLLMLAQTLLLGLAEPFLIDGRRTALTVSIGVAVATPQSGPDALLRGGEIAMYRAKDQGRNQVCRYESAMATAQEDRFQLEQSLRESLGTAAFRLVYQPIVALKHDTIAGFETLLRWTDRVRGEVPPTTFIPIAEATGLIVPLGRSVLEWACLEAASWSEPRTIAVNLSPAQFHAGHLARIVRDTLAHAGLPPERLELEITEGMLLEDTGPVHDTMFALRDIGVSLSLDDFGTGHAGLSYLSRFPFSKLKIDRSFICNLGSKESDVIVEEMLFLARRLNMKVVAEGVETEQQLERLRALGCDFVQGYLTGRPVPPETARHL